MSVTSVTALCRQLAAACLMALSLSACAAGGAMQGEAPITSTPHRTNWEAVGPPRAVILALHGYGDHASSTFADAAPAWAARGLHVAAYDHRGFGHNADRSRWPGADRLIADAVAEAGRLRAGAPDLPLFLLGHSMGGGIALAAAGAGAPVDGVILVAPAISGGPAVGPLARLGLWGIASLLPDKRWTGEGLVELQASDNIEALRRLAADPLYLGSASAREILGLVRIMDRATEAAPSVTVPVLVLVGDRDELIPPDAIVKSATAVAGLDTVRRYPEGWHLLLRDQQAPTVWADIADWIEDQAS